MKLIFPIKLAAATALMFGFASVVAGAVQVSILTPAQRATIHDNSGKLVVKVSVDPPINPQDGRSVRLLLDGRRAAPDSSSPSFDLNGIDRGGHLLQARLVGRKGQTIGVSETIQFTMWHASINNPAQRHK
jgi:hypothetical protein